MSTMCHGDSLLSQSEHSEATLFGALTKFSNKELLSFAVLPSNTTQFIHLSYYNSKSSNF